MFPVVLGIVCGETGNCYCSGMNMECKGYPGMLPIREKTGVYLSIDMLGGYEHAVDYDTMLGGYTSVYIHNSPKIACYDERLSRYIKDCVTTPPVAVTSHQTSELPSDPYQHYKNDDDEDNNEDRALVVTVVFSSIKLTFLSCVVYQILVSLVFFHKRMDMLLGKAEKAPMIVRCMIRFLAFMHGCRRRCYSRTKNREISGK